MMAQSNFQPSLKLYTNFQYVGNDPLPSLFGIPTNSWRFKGFTPAFQLFNEAKWSYHELELSNFRIRNTERQLLNIQEYLFGVRYEYGRVLDIDLGEKWLPMLGGSARIYYYRRNETPNVANRFPRRLTEFKTVFGVVPRIQYRFRDNFSFDFNVTATVLAVGSESELVENPVLSFDNQRTSSFNTEFFLIGSLTPRLGLVYHLQ